MRVQSQLLDFLTVFKRWWLACLLEQMEEEEKDREQILLTIFWLEGVGMPLIGLPGLLGKAT